MHVNIYYWIGFNAFIILMLVLDLGVFNRVDHRIKLRESLLWTFFWIFLAMIFNVIVWYYAGTTKALEFFTGYVIEKSLSVDNIFVFTVIFSYFRVPDIYQHRVLFWGIIGALVLRGIFIFAGIALIENFHWSIYFFGAILVFTGVKMFTDKSKEIDPEKNPFIRLIRKYFRVTNELHGHSFVVKINHKWYVTPLFLVLVLVETADIIFAVDSIPAILAITQDRFIVYTSNVFAILGLRSLYFALAGIMDKFRYLSTGLAIILIFIGFKMIVVDFYKIPVYISLIFIAITLTISILLSLRKVRNIPENDKTIT